MYIPVEMVQNGDQEVFVELKGVRELFGHLPDTVYELDKDGCSLIVAMVLVSVTDALGSQQQQKIDKFVIY